ncbi:MAG: DNA-3-methyladenine glycosylase [Bryobacterales bacterium]|nr:DNA-3-methyladenine glycosylase [Bryobacterales bacterium]
MTGFETMLRRAERHLRSSCPHMRRLVKAHGPCGLKLRPDPFQMLVASITSQQISGAAARSILGRLENGVGPIGITPSSVRACGEAELRTFGYSARKASYLMGLAVEVADGHLDLSGLKDLDDSGVVARLVQLRGIGEWTAHMLLIFSLGRPDVLPHSDLGVRQAIRGFHGLERLPTKTQVLALAAPWRPFASVASWYCWRSLDANPGGKGA